MKEKLTLQKNLDGATMSDLKRTEELQKELKKPNEVKKRKRRQQAKADYHFKVFKKTKEDEQYYQVMVNEYPIILNEQEVNTLLDKLKEMNTTAHFVITSIITNN